MLQAPLSPASPLPAPDLDSVQNWKTSPVHLAVPQGFPFVSVTWGSHLGSQSSLVSDTGDDARMGSVIFILFMMTNIIFIYGNRADL